MAKSKSEQDFAKWQREKSMDFCRVNQGFSFSDIGEGVFLSDVQIIAEAVWHSCAATIVEAMKEKAFDGSILSEDLSKKPKSFGVIKLIDLIEYVEGEK